MIPRDFDLKEVKAPVTDGTMLKALVTMAETPGTREMIVSTMLKQLGMDRLRGTEATTPPFVHTNFQYWRPRDRVRSMNVSDLDGLVSKGKVYPTSADYVEAYKSGRITPVQVAEKILSLMEDKGKALGLFIHMDPEDIMKQAEASTQRYRSGETLGPLDGVPIAVKDELDQVPYPTTQGTSFIKAPAGDDAFAVKRLRALGALLIGKTNMHEIGLGVTGINPHYGPARNPHDPKRVTGGSSSGSAAAVASGLVPIALGADGGGSIRIPAGFCGVFGLKPTFGRVSERGAAPLTPTLGHVGPIASNLEDLALAYAAIAGPDPHDHNSQLQPSPTLKSLSSLDLNGLKIGVYHEWVESSDPDVLEAFHKALDVLREEGATVVEIEIHGLGLMHLVHLVTIATEIAAAHVQYYEYHRSEYGYDTRMSLVLGRALAGLDYFHAQRLRQEWSRHFFELLEEVDVIATPMSPITAPRIPTSALKTGQSNLGLTTKVMWFSPEANLTGAPAISIPIGYDSDNMPIALQVIGRPWTEDLLLRVGASLQKTFEPHEPREFFPPLF